LADIVSREHINLEIRELAVLERKKRAFGVEGTQKALKSPHKRVQRCDSIQEQNPLKISRFVQLDFDFALADTVLHSLSILMFLYKKGKIQRLDVIGKLRV
jgi:hypothetical protein